ncbi:MAG: vitamin K epoxide reductase family protein [Acidobacteria bacterium]|nr:vitamin K epoxide reductase family protein [Acidobacteriota bacterium]
MSRGAAGRVGAEGEAGRGDVAPPAAATRGALLLDTLAALLALVGLGDAVYLTTQHLLGNSLRCTITSGCSEVLGSDYATVAGYPLAALGAVAYFTAFSLATLAAFGYARARGPLAILVASMLLVTLWLLYVQAYILHAFCQYCLLSAAITGALALVVLAHKLRRTPFR